MIYIQYLFSKYQKFFYFGNIGKMSVWYVGADEFTLSSGLRTVIVITVINDDNYIFTSKYIIPTHFHTYLYQI